MQEILNNISSVVIKYQKLPEQLTFDSGGQIQSMLRELSSNLFFLEEYRDNYSRKYNAIMYTQIKEGNSVSGAEIVAKERVPELYQLRRLMTSGYRCLDCMRSALSFIKAEKNG